MVIIKTTVHGELDKLDYHGEGKKYCLLLLIKYIDKKYNFNPYHYNFLIIKSITIFQVHHDSLIYQIQCTNRSLL
jgi:hypothetical protein